MSFIAVTIQTRFMTKIEQGKAEPITTVALLAIPLKVFSNCVQLQYFSPCVMVT